MVKESQKPMTCPICKAVELSPHWMAWTQQKVQRCPKCKGMWLDAKQLEEALGEVGVALRPPPGSRLVGRKCPNCRRRMVHFDYPGTFVGIEMCVLCPGIWLDKGEFKEVQTVRSYLRQADVVRKANEPKGFKGKLITTINVVLATLWESLLDPT